MVLRGTFGEASDGRAVLFDDNSSPTLAFLWAAQRTKGVDVQFNHVWQCAGDPDASTALSNICCTPAFLAKATDSDPGVTAMLRYRAWDLYGMKPASDPEPVQPRGYGEIAWAPMPEPVGDVEAVMRGRLSSSPMSRPAVAAREIGWVFSDGPDPSI